MSESTDSILIRPGASVEFGKGDSASQRRDDLLEKLDALDLKVPPRHQGRSIDQREHYCMLRYLRFLAEQSLLKLPVTLKKSPQNQDPPDFVLQWGDGSQESFELTDGSTQERQRALAQTSGERSARSLPVDVETPSSEAAELWADIIFNSYLAKATKYNQGRFCPDHLLIYDLTGLGLLVPLEDGAPALRQRIHQWLETDAPDYRFQRVSVLRDLGLLLDVTGIGQVVRGGSPYFQVPAFRATDEQDLRQRLRKIDRYCRKHSIRHLKAFGSVLRDLENLVTEESSTTQFRADSDFDLLVEFEPGTIVTLPDMTRMERELSELIGFKVDLRTANELSRYFRQDVLDQAVGF